MWKEVEKIQFHHPLFTILLMQTQAWPENTRRTPSSYPTPLVIQAARPDYTCTLQVQWSALGHLPVFKMCSENRERELKLK